jgi:hypothetical protein
MLEPLAAYELDLIQQSFDAAARLYPVFKGVPVAELIKQRNPERAPAQDIESTQRNAL